MGMTDQEKISKFRIVVIVAVVIIAVLGVLLFYDNYKLYKAQNAYNQGWNECAISCNAKINILNDRCNGIVLPVEVTTNIPQISNESEVVIQIV
jgi:predicted RNase H-related nuclease YkuK (DUF458 family)